MKKRLFFGFCSMLCAFALLFPVIAKSNGTYNWYCPKSTEHKQPILDKSMAFIEEYDGYYVDKRHGDDCSDKVVYLTFDAGYENGNIERILNTLKEENVSGAFFILSNLVLKNPDLVMRMANEGHTVCNHTSLHKDVTSLDSIEKFEDELLRLNAVYQNATGKELSKYFRPPEGRFSRESMEYAQRLGYKTIFWSVAYADWDNNRQMSVDEAKTRVLQKIHNGAVILLHPTSRTNADMMTELIHDLKEQGYRFGTLDELCAV